LTSSYYNDNGITLYHDRCEVILPTLPDCSVDMVLADLPYQQTRNTWDSAIDLDFLWPQYRRIVKPNGAIILFGQGMFSAVLMMSNPKEYRYSLIWEKDRPTGFLNANRMPLRSHEDIHVFYRSLPTYHPQMWQGEPQHSRGIGGGVNAKKTTNYGAYTNDPEDPRAGNTLKHPRSVLHFPKPHPAKHPTEKPVALCAYLIRMFSNPGDVVLDNTAGIASTGVACQHAGGRRFIGIECDEEYCQIAVDRFAVHNPMERSA